MATIRRSGKGWQALIRKKDYLGPKAKTFRSKLFKPLPSINLVHFSHFSLLLKVKLQLKNLHGFRQLSATRVIKNNLRVIFIAGIMLKTAIKNITIRK